MHKIFLSRPDSTKHQLVVGILVVLGAHLLADVCSKALCILFVIEHLQSILILNLSTVCPKSRLRVHEVVVCQFLRILPISP